MAEEKDTRPCDDMSESRIKSGRKQRFTVLYKSAIEDKRLPLDARGLLAIMVGLPDGWQYCRREQGHHPQAARKAGKSGVLNPRADTRRERPFCR